MVCEMERKPTCAIVVPVYRETLPETERISFERCLSVLGSHPIILVTYPGLDLEAYRERAHACGATFSVRHFGRKSFDGIHGYNTLMLSPAFYDAFRDFDYILICQLDAYVFEDRLEAWCAKDYDYIGGPVYAPRSTDLGLATVGNGGFSLRRIEAFRNAVTARLSPFARRKPHPYINWRKKIIYSLMLASSGRSERLRAFFSHWVPEDLFFSLALQGTKAELHVPAAAEALDFAIDLHPEVAFDRNGADWRPFGWHQWHRFPQYRDKLDLPGNPATSSNR